MKKETYGAVVLAAGKGKRMHSVVQKQFLMLRGKPVIFNSLEQFEQCPFINEIVLVTGEEEIDYCRKEIVEKFNFQKVKKIVAGGAERFLSVYNGLKACTCDFVYIHDGARPFVDQAILERTREDVNRYGACVAGMPVKDTIKISDGDGYADVTPPRSRVWMVQTPQVFAYSCIKDAYDKLIAAGRMDVTDDAMVLECMTGQKTRLTLGSYENIKITTPEDLEIAEVFAARLSV